MVRVFHNPKTNFMNVKISDAFLMTPEELVAEIDTDNMNEAYRLTNHIDKPWDKNPEVKCIKPSRSTSIGDFMELNGVWYAVAPIGFEKV